MAEKPKGAALKQYLSALVATFLFPLQWIRLVRLSAQHHGMDPRAQKKMVGAIAASLLVFGGAAYLVWDFEAGATAGVYETLDGTLSTALGNDAYEAFLKEREGAENLIATADRKVAEAQAAGDAEAEQTWQAIRDENVQKRNTAIANANRLEPNVALYMDVQEAVIAQDDAEAKRLIQQRGAIGNVNDGLVAQGFATKDSTMAQMKTTLNWFVYPGLVGALWAPTAFMGGKILRNSWVPSESVGFKPYPGTAAALFLLFGAFGVPALFFAAAVNMDFEVRTVEGQIAL